MELLNEIHPSSIFRFVNVRGPQPPSIEKNASGKLVTNRYDDLALAQLSMIEADEPLLYSTLLSRASESNALELVNVDFTNYKTDSNFFIKDIPDFTAKYAAFSGIIDWIDGNGITTDKEEWENKIEEFIGDNVVDYAISDEALVTEFRIWDNLLFHFLRGDIELVPLLSKALAVLQLIRRLSQGDTMLESGNHLRAAYAAMPLFPFWLFKIMRKSDEDPDEGMNEDPEPTEDRPWTQNIAQINKLRIIKKEINRALRIKWMRQMQSRENQEIPDWEDPEYEAPIPTTGESPYNLYENDIEALSEDAQEFIESTGITHGEKTNAEYLLKDIDDAITTLSSQVMGAANGNDSRGIVGFAPRVIYTVTQDGSNVVSSENICLGDETKIPKPCAEPSDGAPFKSENSFFHSAFVGDLIVTKQQLIKYALGEVAHIETIMLGELRQREFRRFNRTEEKEETETKTTTETERESQTTERFSVEKEVTKSLSQDFSISAGVNISAKLGVVNMQANTNVSYGFSQQQGSRDATSFSKEVTNRALERIKQEVRTLRSFTVINETEDKTFHEYNNKISEYPDGITPDHVNGVYRWVDKYYLNKLVNYGRRLFLEFLIPEPANFFIYRLLKKSVDDTKAFEMPLHPSKLNLVYTGNDGSQLKPGGVYSADDINEFNYKFLAAYYGVEGIDVFPQSNKTIGVAKSVNWTKTGDNKPSDKDIFFTDNETLQIPTGYQSFIALITVNTPGQAIINVGHSMYSGGTISVTGLSNIGLFKEGSIVPVSGKFIASGGKGEAATVNVNVICTITPEAITAWKIKVYEKIMQAYNRKQQEFNEWLQQQKAQSDFDGQEIQGNNPAINRQIEKEELKKRCLEMFSGQRWESFDAAVAALKSKSNYPEILFVESLKEGVIANFFEKAFDWENITYEFFPYYYGKKNNWCSVTKLRDNDPVFENFLKAGFARVLVPVTPLHEALVAAYAAFVPTQKENFPYHWFTLNGLSPTSLPVLDFSKNPGTSKFFFNLLLDVAEGVELSEEKGELIGWHIQKVPTNLVYLASVDNQTAPNLPDNTSNPEIEPFIKKSQSIPPLPAPYVPQDFDNPVN